MQVMIIGSILSQRYVDEDKDEKEVSKGVRRCIGHVTYTYTVRVSKK